MLDARSQEAMHTKLPRSWAWVCNPRPNGVNPLVGKQLGQLRGGRRRQLDLGSAKSFARSDAHMSQSRLARRKSLQIQQAVGFDPHRPYQSSYLLRMT